MRNHLRALFFLLTLAVGGLSLRGAETFSGVPRAHRAATELWVLDGGLIKPDSELLVYASLQGLLAKNGSPKQLYFTFRNTGYEGFLEVLENDYKVRTHRGETPEAVLRRFAPAARGYVLYDARNPDSIQVATMVAGLKNAAVVEAGLERKIAGITGWGKVADVGGWKVADFLREPRTWLKADFAADLSPNSASVLRDYLIYAGSPVAYDSAFPTWIDPRKPSRDRPLFGWGNTKDKGEREVIRSFSKNARHNIPTNGAHNLSVLSAFEPGGAIAQRTPATQIIPGNEKTHLVAFVLTDGDNLGWTLKSFAGDGKQRWFSSPLRGKFPMNYGLSPSLRDLAPPALQWFYRNAKTGGAARDYFVAGPSGLGYFYPTDYPGKKLLAEHTRKLARTMAAAGMRYVEIIDTDAAERADLWKLYLDHPEIGGLILLDYVPYHKYAGKLSWVNGKPVASLRFSLWTPLKGCENEEVAEKLNKLPRDLTKADGYSIVGVHCWSKSLADVEKVIGLLRKDTRVVTLDVLMETMRAHVKR
ncbi:MAG: hypothetical protein LBR12_05775 [Opitutaceae bacterium]|jgi:hypothetical protein|nr:hypothetical protein [Opitutaceae bacterium]